MNLQSETIEPKIWFSADWHWGEERLELMGRPFDGPQDMYEEIYYHHSYMIKPGDTLYLVGDVVSKAAKDPEYWLQKLSNIKCNKILFRGNHDTIFTDDQLKPYFDQIYPEGVALEMVITDLNKSSPDLSVAIQHYPSQSTPFKFNVVGHIHDRWKVQKNMLNVGVDVSHFRPVSAAQVRFYFDAICSFYDDDVWVADHVANRSFEARNRGMEGSYFGKKNMGGKVGGK